MFIHENEIRVRYAETDQMGYVYYGNYASYFEVCRVESLREIGVSYAELEKEGILLPVIHYEVKFLKPALYDQILRIQTWIKDLPAARIHFEYSCRNEKDEVLSEASTTLIFMDAESRKPMRCPGVILSKMDPYFGKG